MDNDGMFKELVENSNDILIVTDQEFIIRYVSSSVTRIFSIESYRVLGASIFSFVSADKIEKWRQCITDSADTTFQEEISLKINGSKNYFDVQVSNFLNKTSVKGLVIKLHDITSKKFRQKELEKANQQLDQVIYKTTHDLKAPLMSAMGLVRLAESAPDQEKGRYIELIKKSLFRLDGFIDEMNNFFRNDKLAIQREQIDMEKLLKEELANLQTLHQNGQVDIGFTIEGKSLLFSDNIRLRTIIGNILSNAIKYRDPLKTNPFIRINVLITEEFCEIRFVDNGIGIEEEFQDKIFDLFFRATDQSQGTGLGLFIVKDTIEKLKGRITVNSVPNKGTTFTISLPNQILQPIEAD